MDTSKQAFLRLRVRTFKPILAIYSYYGKGNRPHRTDIQDLMRQRSSTPNSSALEIRDVRRWLCNVQDLSKRAFGGGFQLGKKVKPGSTVFYVNVDTIPATQQKAEKASATNLEKEKVHRRRNGYWGTIAIRTATSSAWSKK